VTGALQWLTDPFQQPFMLRALIEVAIMGALTGLLGAFVVVRGLAFIGDALSHAVFPGVVIAYFLGQSMVPLALICGLLTSLGIGLVSRDRRISEDTAIGITFAGAFALGVVLISSQKSYTRDLSSFLFGDVLGVAPSDIWAACVLGAFVVAALVLLYKELVLVAFDQAMAAASGYPVFALDLLLLGLLTVTIIIALPAVGNILVLAMLVTPAATARLLSHRFPPLLGLAAAVGVVDGAVGLVVSYRLNTAAGGTIVLIATLVFALVFFSSRGRRFLHRRRDRWPAQPGEVTAVPIIETASHATIG